MSINNLPNEVLFMIFDHFNGFEELIRLSKVSPRWFLVVLLKFSKVKYLQLMDKRQRDGDYIENNKLWKNTRETLKSHNLRDLLPNLRIMEVPKDVFLRLRSPESYDFRRLINEHPKIRGLIGLYEPVEFGYNLENIEMISSDFKFEFKKVFRPNQLKQIRLKQIYMSEFYQYVEYFPSLKRLSLTLYYDSAKPYNGPKLLDLKSSNSLQTYMAYYLTWTALRRILSKFPNLHHLAIRGYIVEESHVEEFFRLLPRIKLIDSRKYDGFIRESADFLSKYCEKSNRPIKIYYDCEEEPNEWPQLVNTGDRICYGFDFMKHLSNCFGGNYG
ncbi:uncharacterized protein LOC128386339 [Panonychus citri]|uniref:uncharacterized protein LOC128386339 n=1 Tax=Panonychus citri TaxID=50023 RepID=UPI002307D014|nr:uncharacterized protein LOC128386339 [Panonychus citri]